MVFFRTLNMFIVLAETFCLLSLISGFPQGQILLPAFFFFFGSVWAIPACFFMYLIIFLLKNILFK